MSRTAFNQDNLVWNQFCDLVDKFSITTVVETGTYLGQSTRDFATKVESVHTIEINDKFFKQAKINLAQFDNVIMYQGDAASILPSILSNVESSPTLFFLDSHWYKDKSLEREVALLADFYSARILKPVLMLHDFKVPDRPEFGYDSYDGVDFEFRLIEPEISKLYVDNFEIMYNVGICPHATHNRGCLIIVPSVSRQHYDLTGCGLESPLDSGHMNIFLKHPNSISEWLKPISIDLEDFL